MEKGLTIKSGFLISHQLPLEDAAEGYRNFKEKQNEYTKVILKPGGVVRH